MGHAFCPRPPSRGVRRWRRREFHTDSDTLSCGHPGAHPHAHRHTVADPITDSVANAFPHTIADAFSHSTPNANAVHEWG